MALRNRRIIDITSLENNMRSIRSSVSPEVRIMAVVKADGYGHGAVVTSEAAIRGGADMLAVATAEEGIQLRKHGITVPVLILGAATADEASVSVKNDLIQTVCSAEMADICERAAAAEGKTASVHMKVDTGMGRIGIRSVEEAACLLSVLEKCRHVRLTGVFTHFSDADGGEAGRTYTEEQFRRFNEIISPLPAGILRHCCNSAAIHRFPEMALDMVRAGISLYGYPSVATDCSLHPCMEWHATVSYVKNLPSGAFVSYGRTYCSSGDIRVATITCGYGDGYHRAAASGAYVLIHGKKAKIIGRICMDQMMADVTDIDNVLPGDDVILIGKAGEECITAEDIASWAGTISYEILLSSGQRVERIFR